MLLSRPLSHFRAAMQVLGGVDHPGFSWGSTAGGGGKGLLSSLPLPPLILLMGYNFLLSSPSAFLKIYIPWFETPKLTLYEI